MKEARYQSAPVIASRKKPFTGELFIGVVMLYRVVFPGSNYTVQSQRCKDAKNKNRTLDFFSQMKLTTCKFLLIFKTFEYILFKDRFLF
jgi:hypothetical protein